MGCSPVALATGFSRSSLLYGRVDTHACGIFSRRTIMWIVAIRLHLRFYWAHRNRPSVAFNWIERCSSCIDLVCYGAGVSKESDRAQGWCMMEFALREPLRLRAFAVKIGVLLSHGSPSLSLRNFNAEGRRVWAS